MNEWIRLQQQAKQYKEAYPAGTRIMLLDMNDPYAPVTPGMRGTVRLVDDIGQIHVDWDDGRCLAIIPQEDRFRRLTQTELEEEAPCQGEGPVMTWG